MSRRAYSLLETIVSVGLLFSAMILLLNLATTSLWAGEEATERLTAAAHASSVLEDYRRRPFSQVAVAAEEPLSSFQADQRVYTVSLEVSAVADCSSDLVRCLSVRVKWNSRRGPAEVRYSTYVTPTQQ